MTNPTGGTAGPGQVLSLTRRSARRRDYELRAGESALGWLRWQPGRRSGAQAQGRGIGPIHLAARHRRVLVAGADSGTTLAAVNRQRGGPVIHTIEGHALRWEKTTRRNHWAIREQGQTVLAFAASHDLLRSSVQIIVQQPMSEHTTVLLALTGGSWHSANCNTKPTSRLPSPQPPRRAADRRDVTMIASSTSRRQSAGPPVRTRPRPAPPQLKGKYLSLTTLNGMAPAWPPRSGSWPRQARSL